MIGSKILQMRLEHPEQKIDIVCRMGDFENRFVTLFARHGGFVSPVARIRPVSDLARIRECDSQRQFFRHEINCSQPHGELLQKPSEHEQQRLGCFDFALKLETLLERLRWPNQFEQSTRSSVGALHIRIASGPSRAPSCSLSSAASWPTVWMPHLCRIAKISCTSICPSMHGIYSRP